MKGKEYLQSIGVPDRAIQGRKQKGQMPEYRASLSEMLEEYAELVKSHHVIDPSNPDITHYDSLKDCCNQLLDAVDVGTPPVRSIRGLRILLDRDDR